MISLLSHGPFNMHGPLIWLFTTTNLTSEFYNNKRSFWENIIIISTFSGTSEQMLNLLFSLKLFSFTIFSQFIIPVNMSTDKFTLLCLDSPDILDQIQSCNQTDVLPPEADYIVATWKSFSKQT